MKIVVLMGIEEDSAEIRSFLGEQQLVVFSELEMQGRKPHGSTDERGNWFSHDSGAIYSRMFFTVLDDAKAEQLIGIVSTSAQARRFNNPLHAFKLQVESFI